MLILYINPYVPIFIESGLQIIIIALKPIPFKEAAMYKNAHTIRYKICIARIIGMSTSVWQKFATIFGPPHPHKLWILESSGRNPLGNFKEGVCENKCYQFEHKHSKKGALVLMFTYVRCTC